MKFERKFGGGLDLINHLNTIAPNGKGVEVGVFRGELSKEIVRIWKNGTIFMVDVWRELGQEYFDVCNNDQQIQYMVDTCNNIQGFEDRANMIRANSETASTLFTDESLDFIYIDANHAYEHVKKDLSLWFPKLKKGGIFAGHDYINIDWYDDNISSKTQMTHDGEVTIRWKNLSDGKNKDLYKIHYGETYYNGVFGVNPAVNEFCSDYGYTLDVTCEIWGSWWLVK